jgi:Ca2+-binding EF-hand superfamily protein
LKDRKIDPPKIVDSFDWEQGIVQKIKEWIKKAQLTVEDAFKCFDKDFDGFVSKVDLKHALVSLLEIDEEEIIGTKLDRLYRLMDFFKQG